LASHTHGVTPVPGNAGEFSEGATRALFLSQKLKPITL
jgi:hypothetical protein